METGTRPNENSNATATTFFSTTDKAVPAAAPVVSSSTLPSADAGADADNREVKSHQRQQQNQNNDTEDDDDDERNISPTPDGDVVISDNSGNSNDKNNNNHNNNIDETKNRINNNTSLGLLAKRFTDLVKVKTKRHLIFIYSLNILLNYFMIFASLFY